MTWVLVVVVVLLVVGLVGWQVRNIVVDARIQRRNYEAWDQWFAERRARMSPQERENEFFAEWEAKNKRGMGTMWGSE